MKNVKIRIAVAIDPSGEWNSCGYSGSSDKDKMDICVDPLVEGEARYWLEADLMVPEINTIQADISED